MARVATAREVNLLNTSCEFWVDHLLYLRFQAPDHLLDHPGLLAYCAHINAPWIALFVFGVCHDEASLFEK